MTVKEQVIKYIKSLDESDRDKLKTMIRNGVVCCVGYARDLNIDIDDFNAELRRIFK